MKFRRRGARLVCISPQTCGSIATAPVSFPRCSSRRARRPEARTERGAAHSAPRRRSGRLASAARRDDRPPRVRRLPAPPARARGGPRRDRRARHAGARGDRGRRRLARVHLDARHPRDGRLDPGARHGWRPDRQGRPHRPRRGYALLRPRDGDGGLRLRPPGRAPARAPRPEAHRRHQRPLHHLRLRARGPPRRARAARRRRPVRGRRPQPRDARARPGDRGPLHRGRAVRRRGPARRRRDARARRDRLRRLRRRQHLHHADRPRPAPGRRDRRARLGGVGRVEAAARGCDARHLAVQDERLGDGAGRAEPADPRGARGRAAVPDGGDRGRARVGRRGAADRRHKRRCDHRRGARRERTVPAPALLGDRAPGGRCRDGARDRADDGAPRGSLRAGRDEGALVTPVAQLREAVEAAAGTLANGDAPPRSRPTLERPKQAGHGDYATNAALVLAPVVGAKPRDVAERLSDALRARLGDALDRVEVAGPGFLNLFLADAWYADALDWVLAAGDRLGAVVPETPEKVNLEFVSANPTGPLTAASGRHAAYGDALARILELAGHAVDREYYFNDEGGQIRRLAESIQARARGTEPPEDGYQGEYVSELAGEIDGSADMDVDALARRGVELVVARIRATLDVYRVHFDTWFTERTLHEGEPSAIDRALARLREQGHLYESEGALWLRTTTFGDDKDRVLIRSTGEPTYFAADVAYHEEKLERGYDRMINVLGSDHHGYVARMKAAIATLGADPERLEIPLLQFVHIVEDGRRAGMSKRRGEFVTLDDLTA